MGRNPSYSGKCIARAVELYYQGVKSGYVRWSELQNTLEEEFPAEFEIEGRDKPSPETVMAWVRKRPDAPQRLRDLRVIKADPDREMDGTPTKLPVYQPPSALLVTCPSNIINDAISCMNWIISVMVGVIMMEIARSWSQD